MSREHALDLAFVVGAVAMTLLLAAPGGDKAVVLVQPVVLGLAFVFAAQCTVRFEADNPVRRPWALLSLGLLAWELGEVTEAVYLLARGGTDPFPSLADVFFVLAYPALIAAFFVFLRVYRATGWSGEQGRMTLALVPVLAGLGYLVLGPILSADAPLDARVVGAAYAGLDLVALVPLLLLLRLAWRLRGGSVWKVWAGVLFGFLLTFLGDVFFAYFHTRPQAELGALSERLDFGANLMFLLSYVAIARGTLHQRELLRD